MQICSGGIETSTELGTKNIVTVEDTNFPAKAILAVNKLNGLLHRKRTMDSVLNLLHWKHVSQGFPDGQYGQGTGNNYSDQ